MPVLYRDAAVEALSQKLEHARTRKESLREAGLATDELDREILQLRRQRREGGQLLAGDALGDGRYLLVKRAGRGGFATVWEAWDTRDSQSVAVKVLHSHHAGDSHRRERFFRGARAMMKLSGPNVVRILAPEEEDGGFYYFVMEHVRGGNLNEAVLEGRLRNEDIFPLILRVCEALGTAHAKGMVHRDIKPSNILLDEKGNPKLTDFDLVTAPDTTGGTRTGALGTLLYSAPECLEKPQEATAQADVYGLGMTAIFSISRQDITMETVRDSRSAIIGLMCSSRVKAVLQRAVAWEPGKRFADASSMGVALREALDMGDTTNARLARGSLDDDDDDSEPDLIGAEIDGRYRVLEPIGEGGMGKVYLAEHIEIGKRVALKVLHSSYSRMPDLVQRFRREARAASKIGHPNIVDIADSGITADGNVYIAMEYLEGVELGSVIEREGALDVARVLKIARQICRALAAAHREGIVHRDLKPENIFLITRDGAADVVKVLDFGTAIATEAGVPRERRLTSPGMAMGTPEYMSPEQAAGRPADARCDVYALGAIMYEMVTGIPPYSGDNFMEILTKKATQDPPPPGMVRSELASQVSDLVMAAMARSPNERPQTMEALEYELNKCLDGRGVAVAQILGMTTDAHVVATLHSGLSMRTFDDVVVLEQKPVGSPPVGIAPLSSHSRPSLMPEPATEINQNPLTVRQQSEPAASRYYLGQIVQIRSQSSSSQPTPMPGFWLALIAVLFGGVGVLLYIALR